MNAMLKRWYAQGYACREDVEAGDRKAGTESSFDEDEFFEAALNEGFTAK